MCKLEYVACVGIIAWFLVPLARCDQWMPPEIILQKKYYLFSAVPTGNYVKDSDDKLMNIWDDASE